MNVTNNRLGYDALVTRFVNGDTTLTNDDIARVYYGYSFTENYSPYSFIKQDSPYYPDSEVNMAFKNGNYSKAIKKSRELLKSNPVSLDMLLILAVSSSSAKQDSLALNAKTRANQIVSMILDSGNGSEEKPLKVICIPDEYFILKSCYKVKKFLGTRSPDRKCDKLIVVLEGEENSTGIYFDISLAWKTSSDVLD